MLDRATVTQVAILSALVLVAPSCSNVSGAAPSNDAGACHANPAGDDDDDGGASTCKPGDADGINGGCYAFDLTVDDNGFTPLILKAQNVGEVTLKVTNKGTKPHDFVVDCLPTPNVTGCPLQSCFPATANIAALAPGASASTTFVTPNPEGIYNFRSDVTGDSTIGADGGVGGLWGQFVIQ